MRNRVLLAAALAAAGTMTIAPAADAAWKGLQSFNCETSRSNWNFDGLMGNYTTRAVRNFQRAKGLKVDGIAGPETLKAMGLRYRRTLRCGMGGNDVFIMQQALAAQGYWYGGEGETTSTPAPTEKPMPKPTPAWTEPPILYTPAPYTTPEPTMAPTMEPTMAPTAEPEEVSEDPLNWPTVEVHGGDWMVPLNAGSTNYDYMFQRPTWVGGGTLWLGNWGLGGEATVFNQTWVDYRPLSAGAYFPQNVTMYDALLKYRMDKGYYNVFAGYRGIGQGNVNFGTLGVAMDRPLAGSWLWLQAKLQGGHNFSNSYFGDGRLGLGLRVDPVTLELGFRQFAFQNQAEPLFLMNGPVAEVRLAF